MSSQPRRVTLSALTPDDAERTLKGQRRSGETWAHAYPLPVDRDMIHSLIVEHNDGMIVGPFTHYQIALEASRLVIGGAGFLGPPDEFGAVEITFGIVPEHIGHGYGAEVVAALVAIAAGGGADFVIASSKVANVGTHSTLIAGGLSEIVRDDITVHFAAILADHTERSRA